MTARFLSRLAIMASLGAAVMELHGQTFDVVRSNPYNGYARGRNVFETPSGFVVFGEQTEADTFLYSDITITKFAPDGTFISEEFMEQPYGQFGISPEPMCALSWAPGFIGSIISNDTIQPDTVRFVRFDANGDFVSVSDIFTGWAAAVQKIVAKNERLYTVGGYDTGPGDTNTVWVMRLDTLNTIDWMYLSRRTSGGEGMDVDQYGNVFIGGIGSYPSDIGTQGCLLRLDSNGVERWYRESPTAIGFSSSVGEWSGVKALSNGNVLCMGRWTEAFIGQSANGMCMAAYDTAGTLLWYHQGLDGSNGFNWETSFFDGYQDTDSTFITCGQVAQSNWRRALVYRFTVDGDSLWRREYAHYASISTEPYERPWDIEPTSDGGMVLTGESWYCAANFCHDLWLLKLDSVGCLVPGCQYVGINDMVFGLQDALLASPNPSAGLFTLQLALPTELDLRGSMQLQVFDAQGRLVLQRALGTAREQQVALDLSAEPAGLYSAHVSDGHRILTGTRLVIE